MSDVRDVTGLHGRARRWLAALVALAAVLAGCSEGPQAAQLPPTPAEPKLTYVALGASDAIGFGADQPLTQAWPQLLVRGELPVSATFVNAAADGSTVAQALDRQLSLPALAGNGLGQEKPFQSIELRHAVSLRLMV